MPIRPAETATLRRASDVYQTDERSPAAAFAFFRAFRGCLDVSQLPGSGCGRGPRRGLCALQGHC